MQIHNVGYHHVHDADFFIDRPNGSGDWLLLILKSESLFTLNGKDVYVPENSVFLYPEGISQQYRCMPQQQFSNDWLHFALEEAEQDKLKKLDIPLCTPISLENTSFFSYCIKMISNENTSYHQNQQENINLYFWLMLNHISDLLHKETEIPKDTEYEMLMTIRNKIYAEPYVPRGVSWAAHEVRMSRTSFQYYYKKQFSVTYMQDLINARMEYAKMLLETTNLTVQDIAVQCGYRNYEHFARQFKERCNITPIEYRNQKM